MNEVSVGQVYKCRRRGHEIKVDSFHNNVVEGAYAYYRNSRGARVSIYIPRLLNPSRFSLVSEVGNLVPKLDEKTNFVGSEYAAP